jgi:hypothetical protein
MARIFFLRNDSSPFLVYYYLLVHETFFNNFPMGVLMKNVRFQRKNYWWRWLRIFFMFVPEKLDGLIKIMKFTMLTSLFIYKINTTRKSWLNECLANHKLFPLLEENFLSYAFHTCVYMDNNANEISKPRLNNRSEAKVFYSCLCHGIH